MLERFESFVTGITACYRYIQRIKTQQMTEFGLKGTHVMCLFYLHHRKEALTAAELCRLCAEDKAAISRALSELEDKKYVLVEGIEKKKYRAPIRLTEAGREVAGHMDALIESWVSIGGDGLTEDQRKAFYRSLGLIAENLREKIER